MSWASEAIAKLQKGETAQVRMHGHSMAGKVNDGALVTLEPADAGKLKKGDIVLVRVGGRIYLHLIKALNNGRFVVGNNRGGLNDTVGANAIYGVATKIEG